MKLVACLLTCLSLPPLAQTQSIPGVDNGQDRTAALQKQRTEALSRERARRKADLCADTGDGSTPAVGNCWLREGKTTDADYTAYVRSIGALLRLSLRSNRLTPPPSGLAPRLAFDTAETIWLRYRTQTCAAMTAQWEGGTLGRVAYPKCLVTVTWDHMNELEDLYSGLLRD